MPRCRSGRTSPSTSSPPTRPTCSSCRRSATDVIERCQIFSSGTINEESRDTDMRVTQGTFSFLPDFTDEQIEAQLKYMVTNHWAVSIEYTDDPHPRNAYWEMWGLPV